MSSLPVNATPGGRAGSANDAPGSRLGGGGSGRVDVGTGVPVAWADGLAFGVATIEAAGEHAVKVNRNAAAKHRFEIISGP